MKVENNQERMTQGMTPRMTPFFGRYILETTGYGWKKEAAKKKTNTKLKKIYEVIDDYIEQV